ncbi:hypothetical protein PAMC26510_01620 [Caballeronia sordidicola]|uniref:Uncharacterized protein n=1 Tax=Caballeronia sordidicola TaxID=196367 RepID=A0A242N9H1_CABSO|nr:hypothetical protein PAMC26510_01620 [Caballeronia sordidicola]
MNVTSQEKEQHFLRLAGGARSLLRIACRPFSWPAGCVENLELPHNPSGQHPLPRI